MEDFTLARGMYERVLASLEKNERKDLLRVRGHDLSNESMQCGRLYFVFGTPGGRCIHQIDPASEKAG